MTRLLSGVVGFLHADEAVALYEAVRHLDVEPVTVVELGACLGRSALAMATALRARGHGELYSVDTFTGANLDEFNRNIAERGFGDLVHPWRGLTHDVRQRWDRGPIGMIFIDASHDYENVSQDLDDWQGLPVPGATVVFNDASQPGVYRMLAERVFAPGSPYHVESLVRSTLFTRYRPGTALDEHGRRARDRIGRVLRVRRLAHPLVKAMPVPIKSFANAVSRKVVTRGS